tara:strand:+ start:2083 stop:3309 length:1227 start_codon:yes stop_codon:yes gene_type:complete
MTDQNEDARAGLPLSGVRVLDIATMGAGPLAATFLADFGADVIKVEHPENGDHIRAFGMKKDGISLYWKTISRNKRAVTLNLKHADGQDLLKELVKSADVVVENFRPGTLEKWNLGYADLAKVNPSLVMLRTTGFGQTGPYSSLPGFGTLAEAMSGFASITGTPDTPPLLPQLALADGVCGAFGAYGVMVALHARDRDPEKRGQVVDASICESMSRLMESVYLEYDQLGAVRQRHGNRLPDAAPRGAYESAEAGKYVALSGSAQPVAMRLLDVIGGPDLAADPRFATNAGRIENIEELDGLIASWMKRHPRDEAVDILRRHQVAAGPVYDVADLFADPHYKARQALVSIPDPDLGQLTVHNVMPRLSRTDGKVLFTGRDKGADNGDVYGRELGLDAARLDALRKAGAI